jgi:hypothetical protein
MRGDGIKRNMLALPIGIVLIRKTGGLLACPMSLLKAIAGLG